MASSYLDKTGLALVWAKIKELVATKVDKVEGKGLSTNDYTSAEKTKLAGIATGAQVNVLEGIQKNGDTVPITNKIANISVPTKTSDITNDSGFITSSSVPTATTTTPKMDGTAAVGTETKWAKGDHVHPSDSTKVDKVDGMGLSSNDYTTADKTKLTNIAAGAEVNQNAFSNIKVGSVTVAADTKTDTVEFVGGTNVTITPDATNDKITITATDTTYSDATTSASGLMSASDKTKLNGIATGAEVNQNAFSNVKVGSTTVAADAKTDTLEFVAGNNITITPDATNDKITITATDTTYTPASETPLMDGTATVGTSAKYAREDHVHPSDTTKVDKVTGKGLSTNDYTTDEKNKLSGIAAGAEVNQNAFSNVKVGTTTIAADGKTDTLELIAGTNITLTPNATNDSVTIVATDTTYTPASESPLMDGTAAVGTSAKYAREDHVHPSDTSRVPTSRTVNGKALSSNISLTASDVSAIPTSAKGTANGVCPLNANAVIDSQYLPSFVDDVVEAYPRSGQTALSSTWLATGSASGTVITPQTGVIYLLMVDTDDYAANTQFRWSGTAYVKLNDGGVSPITNSEINTICV